MLKIEPSFLMSKQQTSFLSNSTWILKFLNFQMIFLRLLDLNCTEKFILCSLVQMGATIYVKCYQEILYLYCILSRRKHCYDCHIHLIYAKKCRTAEICQLAKGMLYRHEDSSLITRTNTLQGDAVKEVKSPKNHSTKEQFSLVSLIHNWTLKWCGQY